VPISIYGVMHNSEMCKKCSVRFCHFPVFHLQWPGEQEESVFHAFISN